MAESQIINRVVHSALLGKKIRVREWFPDGPAQGDVLLLHGLGDHSARHDWAAAIITRQGFRAIGFDWPGNGESDGGRGDMPGVSEAGQLLGEMIETLPCTPTGIFAHSTGAFLLLHWLGRGSTSLSALRWVWLSSPLISPSHGQRSFKIYLARCFAPHFPGMTLNTGVKLKKCFHPGFDPDLESQLLTDGSHHRVSLRFAMSLLESEGTLGTAVEGLEPTISFLITQGSEDEVCPPCYAEKLFRDLPVTNKVLVIASGARHEPFRELQREGITHAVSSWLRNTVK